MSSQKPEAKKRLGAILVEMGVLTQDQLEAALKIQSNEGGLLGAVLVKMGFVSEGDITIALARQNAIPYIPILNCDVQPAALKHIPSDFAFKNKLLPFDIVKENILVVFAEPTNQNVMLVLKEMVKMKIHAYVGLETEVMKAVQKYYKLDDNGKSK